MLVSPSVVTPLSFCLIYYNFKNALSKNVIQEDYLRSASLCPRQVDKVARKHFPGVESALARPLLYSSWLSKVRFAMLLIYSILYCT